MKHPDLHGTCRGRGLYSLQMAPKVSFPDRKPICMSSPSIAIIGDGRTGLTAAHIVGQPQQRTGQKIPQMRQKPPEQVPVFQTVFALKTRSHNNYVRIPEFKKSSDVLRPVRLVRVKVDDEPIAFDLNIMERDKMGATNSSSSRTLGLGKAVTLPSACQKKSA